eukprot:10626659-Alexandrium_andersonii.AAC.1
MCIRDRFCPCPCPSPCPRPWVRLGAGPPAAAPPTAARCRSADTPRAAHSSAQARISRRTRTRSPAAAP